MMYKFDSNQVSSGSMFGKLMAKVGNAAPKEYSVIRGGVGSMVEAARPIPGSIVLPPCVLYFNTSLTTPPTTCFRLSTTKHSPANLPYDGHLSIEGMLNRVFRHLGVSACSA